MLSNHIDYEPASHVPTNHSRDLTRTARDRLEGNAYFRGRSRVIRIDEQDGTLVLNGRLPSFYLKQLLQTVLSGIDGVKRIENRVEVFWPDNVKRSRDD